VVSPQNPLKKASGLLNEYDRLYLVQMAIENNPNFRASDIEFKLPRPSYTIDTLSYLKEKFPQHDFKIIVGSDSLTNINRWKNSESLLKNFSFYVYERPGFLVDTARLPAESCVEVVKAPLLDISSTFVRNAVKSGKSIEYFVHDKVAKEIERNGYYRK
jgi:nicotinate-nucleotide adenylyltransferase